MMVRCFYSLSISAYHSYGEKFARDGQNIEEDQFFSDKIAQIKDWWKLFVNNSVTHKNETFSDLGDESNEPINGVVIKGRRIDQFARQKRTESVNV